MGVAVGIVGVTVGVSSAVAVGAVRVGKGPRSAFAVIASAVFVLFAVLWAPESRPLESPKTIVYSNRIKATNKRHSARTFR